MKNILISIFLLGIMKAEVIFNEHPIDDNIGGNGSIYGCDIDDDGDIDLLVANIEDNAIFLYRNDQGNPIAWTKIVIDTAVVGARSVHANDLDGDGDVDVIGASYTGSKSVLWWRNDGGNPTVWTRFSVSQTFRNAHEVYSVDVDKDNDIDILSASSDQNSIAIWHNDGGDPIIWTRQTLSSTELLAKSVHAGDLDNDGNMDIVGAALQLNDVAWWKNDGGNPIAWTRYLIDGNFTGAHRVEAVDIDDDGDLDILGAGYTGDIIAWWRNDGGDPISWARQNIGISFNHACVATAKDIDNDGDFDVIGTGQESNQIAWWESDGKIPITWTKHIITNSFTRPWPLFVGDFDNDTDNDIVVSSSHNGSRKILWWENTPALDVEKANDLPNSFELYQNYPNPFNPTTSISYELPQESNVSIKVFNLLGHEIKTLVNAYKSVGQYQVTWDGINNSGERVSDGIYFYQLKADEFVQTKKMILLK